MKDYEKELEKYNLDLKKSQRRHLADLMANITVNGEPYFNLEWILKLFDLDEDK
jgi:hypothetical protein